VEIVVTLQGQGSGQDATLTFDVEPRSDSSGDLYGEVGLVWGILEARMLIWLKGFRIADFIRELEQVYESRAGKARLLEESNNVLLTITGSDRFHGKAEVCGEWTAFEGAPGAEVTVHFRGTILEPEGIATLARQLRKLLHETGADIRRPSYEQQWPWPAAATQVREWWERRRAGRRGRDADKL
jgi:hypothetical protein